MISDDSIYKALDSFPKVSILPAPTPVVHLQKIGEIVNHPNLWLKNDSAAGFLTGGSKVRVLEYLIGQAKTQAVSTLRTFGYEDSNFVFTTALYCSFFGIQINAILMNNPTNKSITNAVFKNRLTQLQSDIRFVGKWSGVTSSMFSGYYSTCDNGQTYSVPIGGASPLGCIGYVAAVREIAKQITEGYLPRPATLVVPVGSGGLLAGLIAGFSQIEFPPNIVGLRVAGNNNLTLIRWLAYRTKRLFNSRLGVDTKLTRSVSSRVTLKSFDSFDSSRPTFDTTSAIDLVSSNEGIELDNKYAGPAMSLFLETAINATDKTKPLLFWNTCNGVSIDEAIRQSKATNH